MVPPWVPDVAPAGGADAGSDDAPDQPAPNPAPAPAPAVPPTPVPIAPAGRFGPARTSLGQFARSGSSDDMRRGLGHYVGKGLGGGGEGGTAARRFGGTARTAGTLYGALSSTASGQAAAPGSPFDPVLLAGRTASEVMDALVEAVRPADGTQDAEASRLAIKNAVSELLTQFPDADLLDLSEDQRLFAIERYAALDVYNRFRLDVGKTIQDKAPSIAAALTRLKEIRDYIKENVSAAMRRVRLAGQAVNARRVTQMVAQALGDTFRVFEDYVR